MTDNVVSLKKTVANAVESAGFALWGMDQTVHNSRQLLHVYIENTDMAKGITVDDCVKVHKHLLAVLRVEMPSLRKVTLEVASPGIKRRLFKVSHYLRYLGHQIRVQLYVLHESGHRRFTGLLKQVTDEKILLCVGDIEYQLCIGDIERANVEA